MCANCQKKKSKIITSMVTSNVDPSKTVTRANAALPIVGFFFGVCVFESDNGADDGDLASAGIFAI